MAKKIVVLGAGYGGLLSALTARKYLSANDAEITVVNRYPFHQITTELHRLSAGNVTEKRVSLPLDRLLKGKNVDIKVATVKKISPDDQMVYFEDSAELSYDVLVIGMGSETAFFGIPGLQENGMILKSIADANRIRDHVKESIRKFSKTKNKADGTIVVGGAGLTGIELIGEFADQVPAWARACGIDPKEISLINVEAAPTILPGFAQELVDRAKSSLEKRGVQFLTSVPITNYAKNKVDLKGADSIETKTMIWTGGVQGNTVVANSGIEVNRGRATVTQNLQSTSHENIFVAGDSAVYFAPGAERPFPPTAQLSWQMGDLIGYNLFAYLKNGEMATFHPVISGTLASLGRKDGIGTLGGNATKLKGLPASLMKEASNMRYLSHINGFSTLAY